MQRPQVVVFILQKERLAVNKVIIEKLIISPEDEFNGNLFNVFSDDPSGFAAYQAVSKLSEEWKELDEDFSYIEASLLQTVENLNSWLSVFRASIRSKELIEESRQKAMDNDFASAQELLMLAKQYGDGFQKEELDATRKIICGESVVMSFSETKESDDLPDFEE